MTLSVGDTVTPERAKLLRKGDKVQVASGYEVTSDPDEDGDIEFTSSYHGSMYFGDSACDFPDEDVVQVASLVTRFAEIEEEEPFTNVEANILPIGSIVLWSLPFTGFSVPAVRRKSGWKVVTTAHHWGQGEFICTKWDENDSLALIFTASEAS